jgi:hypothetical protein
MRRAHQVMSLKGYELQLMLWFTGTGTVGSP